MSSSSIISGITSAYGSNISQIYTDISDNDLIVSLSTFSLISPIAGPGDKISWRDDNYATSGHHSELSYFFNDIDYPEFDAFGDKGFLFDKTTSFKSFLGNVILNTTVIAKTFAFVLKPFGNLSGCHKSVLLNLGDWLKIELHHDKLFFKLTKIQSNLGMEFISNIFPSIIDNPVVLTIDIHVESSVPNENNINDLVKLNLNGFEIPLSFIGNLNIDYEDLNISTQQRISISESSYPAVSIESDVERMTLYEMRVYDRQLTNSEISQLTSYLLQTYF